MGILCREPPRSGFMQSNKMSEPKNQNSIRLEFEGYRRYLFKFAMLQIRDQDAVEDLVQETMVAALTAADGFSGKSSVRTWLTSILIHKIIDLRRKAGRQHSISIDALQEDGGAESVEALFKESGRYVELPRDWGDPEKALSQRRFFEVLEACVQGLSETAARVFLLREMMGFSTEEICRELSVSSTNCSVLLYRARMRLRTCMDQRWIAADETRRTRT
jgi:RNA polymerase sigma-70 factor (ECF subfamily)